MPHLLAQKACMTIPGCAPGEYQVSLHRQTTILALNSHITKTEVGHCVVADCKSVIEKDLLPRLYSLMES